MKWAAFTWAEWKRSCCPAWEGRARGGIRQFMKLAPSIVAGGVLRPVTIPLLEARHRGMPVLYRLRNTPPSEQPTNAREMWTWPRQKENQDQAEWHWKKNKNIDKMDFLTSSQPISTRFYFTKILLVFIERGQVLSWVIFMFASNSPIREGFRKRGRNLPLPSVYRAEYKIST